MRPFLILVLTVGLAASAGCFGKDDDPPATTTPTGGTTPATGGTSPTGATPTTNNTNTTPTTPAKPAPKALCTIGKDFSSQQPDPATQQATSTGDCGAVTAGYTTVTLEGNWTAATPLPVNVQQGVAVDIVDAAGTVVASCAGPSPGPMQAATPCAPVTGSVTPGAYTLVFHGAGSIRFDGTATIS